MISCAYTKELYPFSYLFLSFIFYKNVSSSSLDIFNYMRPRYFLAVAATFALISFSVIVSLLLRRPFPHIYHQIRWHIIVCLTAAGKQILHGLDIRTIG